MDHDIDYVDGMHVISMTLPYPHRKWRTRTPRESPTSTLTSPSRRRQAWRARALLAIAPPRGGSGRLRLSDAVASCRRRCRRACRRSPYRFRPDRPLRFENGFARRCCSPPRDALGFGGGRWQRVGDGSQIALEAERLGARTLSSSGSPRTACPRSALRQRVLHIATAQAIVAVGCRGAFRADDALFNADPRRYPGRRPPLHRRPRRRRRRGLRRGAGR